MDWDLQPEIALLCPLSTSCPRDLVPDSPGSSYGQQGWQSWQLPGDSDPDFTLEVGALRSSRPRSLRAHSGQCPVPPQPQCTTLGRLRPRSQHLRFFSYLAQPPPPKVKAGPTPGPSVWNCPYIDRLAGLLLPCRHLVFSKTKPHLQMTPPAPVSFCLISPEHTVFTFWVPIKNRGARGFEPSLSPVSPTGRAQHFVGAQKIQSLSASS